MEFASLVVMGKHAWIGRTLRTAAWAPASVVLAYAAAIASLGPAAPPWLDSIAHITGGAAMTYFGLAAMRHLQERVGQTPLAVRLVAAVGVAAVSAIAWELLEFLVDLNARTRLAPSIEDTLLDLTLGLVGALVYAFAVAVKRNRG
jgi:hypothetical protein